ncbi:hypothetical protein [Paenibacillus gorillae]|uniref:hypothetical protein n=1 Tax=Paenibacillus gorillae TaxID=1243662 RepID=UPI0004B1C4A0|nr:hypothetical protein [Paenibacillus gorillae]
MQMQMTQWLTGFSLFAGQTLFGFIAVLALFRLLPRRRPRWTHIVKLDWQHQQLPDRWLQRLQLARDQSSFTERETLLAGCGLTADAAWYIAGRRILLVVLPLVMLGVLGLQLKQGRAELLSIGLVVMIAALYADLPWLRSIRKLRAYRITKEIYIMSNQLLYLAESSLHIHTKLTRCVPYTRVLRGEMDRLLTEWYHDAEQALRRFKHRIGTDDGMSFAETIDSLRLHESPEYYELLRERIQDYKEKLELAKESRKETASYGLFIIAGIPILYTFQVFIYPWIREGQKLFESLG